MTETSADAYQFSNSYLVFLVTCRKLADNHTSAALDYMVRKRASTGIYLICSSFFFLSYKNLKSFPQFKLSHTHPALFPTVCLPQHGSASENSSVKSPATSSFKFFQWDWFCQQSFCEPQYCLDKMYSAAPFHCVSVCYFRRGGKFQVHSTCVNNKISFSVIWWVYFYYPYVLLTVDA